MSMSKIIHIPEWTELDIPEKSRVIRINDNTIFRDILNQNRTVTEKDGPAENGDYVLAEVTCEGRDSEEVLSISPRLIAENKEAYEALVK